MRRVLRRGSAHAAECLGSGEGRVNGSRLTSREEALLNEVAKGRTNREIALTLGSRKKTVSVTSVTSSAKLAAKQGRKRLDSFPVKSQHRLQTELPKLFA